MNQARLKERLITSARKKTGSDCWHWSGQISNTGHGRTMVKDADGVNRIKSAEFVSYEAFIGPVPDGMLVRQTCSNRLCINPDHLEIFDPGGQ